MVCGLYCLVLTCYFTWVICFNLNKGKWDTMITLALETLTIILVIQMDLTILTELKEISMTCLDAGD